MSYFEFPNADWVPSFYDIPLWDRMQLTLAWRRGGGETELMDAWNNPRALWENRRSDGVDPTDYHDPPAEALRAEMDRVRHHVRRRTGLMAHPKTPTDVLRELFDLANGTQESSDTDILARNPNTPPDLLDWLARKNRDDTRCWVAVNPATSRETLEYLAVRVRDHSPLDAFLIQNIRLQGRARRAVESRLRTHVEKNPDWWDKEYRYDSNTTEREFYNIDTFVPPRKPGGAPAQKPLSDAERELVAGAGSTVDERIAAVGAYVAARGVFPPQHAADPDVLFLGKWLARQRDEARAGRMDPTRLEAMDTALPGWRATREEKWDAALDRLVGYYAEHNKAPWRLAGNPEEAYLAQWLREQRKALANNTITSRRRNALDTKAPGWVAEATPLEDGRVTT